MATKKISTGKVTPVPAEQWASPRDGGPKNATPRGAQAGPIPKKAPLGKREVAVKDSRPTNESGTQMGKPDLINRDPREINAHLKVSFGEILGERPSTHSIDCVWRCSYSCFTCCRNFWYKLGSIFCACPMSIIYGILFVFPAFTNVWCCTPWSRLLEITIAKSCNRCLTMCLKCLFGPCCEACGQLFYHLNPIASATDKKPLLPVTSKARGKQVQFNDNVKTKRIPRNNNGFPVPTGRRQLVQNKQ